MSLGQQMDGCGQCMKYTLFAANLVCFLGGLAVLAVGAWTVADSSYMSRLLGTDLFMSTAYILIAAGIIIALLAFLGCFGAIKEVKCMLITYAFLMFLIFVVLLVGGILGYVFRGEVQDKIRSAMTHSMEKYNKEEAYQETWDDTQRTLKCCGIDKPSDWKNYGGFNNNNEVPESCCLQNREKECVQSPNGQNSYQDGCFDVVLDYAQSHAKLIGGVGIGIAILLLTGIIFSCAVFKSIE